MLHNVEVSCTVNRSFRVDQVRGMFDLQPEDKSHARFAVEIPATSEEWQVGLIVGPSGSGKSTIARQAFPNLSEHKGNWPADRAVIDGFPKGLSIKDITATLSSVGLSSPPAWVKPYQVLSNGERFRCDLAKAILSADDIVAFDEFTSVVDRTVAQIGSAALAKFLRSGRTKKRFVAVTCHYDVADWLQADWVVDMATCTLARGRLQRPPIKLEVIRCKHDAWRLFKRHHYLTDDLNKSAICFMALINGEPVAFDAWLQFFGKLKDSRSAKRGHRTVCLPDFQGVGIGAALFNHNASLFAGLGFRAFSGTAHPAEIRSRLSKPHLWRCTSLPTFHAKGSHSSVDAKRATGRRVASFEWIGPKMDPAEGRKILGE